MVQANRARLLRFELVKDTVNIIQTTIDRVLAWRTFFLIVRRSCK